jgi:hypothetical protein
MHGNHYLSAKEIGAAPCAGMTAGEMRNSEERLIVHSSSEFRLCLKLCPLAAATPPPPPTRVDECFYGVGNENLHCIQWPSTGMPANFARACQCLGHRR